MKRSTLLEITSNALILIAMISGLDLVILKMESLSKGNKLLVIELEPKFQNIRNLMYFQ